MIFNSLNFIVLFPFIFLLYYAIPAGHGRARNLFLLAVSYLLYMQWKPAYALVLLGVTAVTWTRSGSGTKIAEREGFRRRAADRQLEAEVFRRYDTGS